MCSSLRWNDGTIGSGFLGLGLGGDADEARDPPARTSVYVVDQSVFVTTNT